MSYKSNFGRGLLLEPLKGDFPKVIDCWQKLLSPQSSEDTDIARVAECYMDIVLNIDLPTQVHMQSLAYFIQDPVYRILIKESALLHTNRKNHVKLIFTSSCDGSFWAAKQRDCVRYLKAFRAFKQNTDRLDRSIDWQRAKETFQKLSESHFKEREKRILKCMKTKRSDIQTDEATILDDDSDQILEALIDAGKKIVHEWAKEDPQIAETIQSYIK